MTLLEIRTMFGKRSGRYDLVTPATWADNGADDFINAGIKYLDGLLDFPKAEATIYETLAIGDWYVLFQKARFIEEVWISNIEEKWQLDEETKEIMREDYEDIPTDIDNGRPLVYRPANVRTTPVAAALTTITKFGATAFTEVLAPYSYNGIIFMPPADEAYTLEIVGSFYSPTLSDDADENYWTVEFPIVVVMSALRQLEVIYRNTEGVKDWDGAILSELANIDKDMAAQASANIRGMEVTIR